MLELLLRSKAEVKILGVVLFEEGLHLREIARRAHVSPSEAKNELEKLFKMGILEKSRKGNLILFSLNPKCSFPNELKMLYLKTEGIVPEIKKTFQKLDKIEFAIVYGSMAKGTFNEKSDIDMLVIGSIDEDELTKQIFKLQQKTGREINYILWSKNDFNRKLKEKGSFIKSLMDDKKIFIKGDLSGFKRIN